MIIDLPTLSSVPALNPLSKHSNLQLTCGASSNGDTKYTWKFNGEAITPSDRIDGTESTTLAIRRLTFGDEGSYTCEVSNIAGTVIQTHRVEVTGELVHAILKSLLKGWLGG